MYVKTFSWEIGDNFGHFFLINQKPLCLFGFEKFRYSMIYMYTVLDFFTFSRKKLLQIIIFLIINCKI